MKQTQYLSNSFLSEDFHYTKYLRTVFQPVLVYTIKGEIFCKVSNKSSKHFLIFLKYHTNALYKQLIDLYGVDYGERFQRFEICYNLLSLILHRRLNVTVVVSEQQKVQSISDLYPNSTWYEREVYDLFGFIFQGNNDFRRILTDYGFKGHPLRKDFPLTGYIEVRYDDFGKRIRYERVSLTQDYRIFTLKNPWSTKKINF